MKLDFLKDFDFFTGVPDSKLKALSTYLANEVPCKTKHIIAANEGNAAAIAAGYHLATGKTPVIYLQNSGIGNITNPVISLMSEHVYAIPALFLIGWRGEPDLPDEPQHIYQGQITLDQLKLMGIEYYVIDKDSKQEDLNNKLNEWGQLFSQGKQAAIVVKQNAIEYDKTVSYENEYTISREQAIYRIVQAAKEDKIVCTTGKASRELYEIRKKEGQSSKQDFLTVGSMGHSSSIALGIALQIPDKRVWCIDGDGAAIMHMGAMAVIGGSGINNLVHVLINNIAHESVGGMPTTANSMKFPEIAKGCGYGRVHSVDNMDELDAILESIGQTKSLTFLEIKCKIGSRKDLGRPDTSARENKELFMCGIE